MSDDKISIGKLKYKLLRSKIHYLTKSTEQINLDRVKEVQGWLSYLFSVDKHKFGDAIKFIRKLKDLHPTTLISQIRIPPLLIVVDTEVKVVS